jgi:hypothetical protein
MQTIQNKIKLTPSYYLIYGLCVNNTWISLLLIFLSF